MGKYLAMKKKPKKKDNNSIKVRIKRKKVPKVLYTITDKYFPDFDVAFTDNAWWVDKVKVEKLIDAFKFDCSVMEACVYAGITYEQWVYFNEKHESFSQIRALVAELPSLQARQTVVKGLAGDKEFALKYLERKKRHEFATHSSVEVGEDKDRPFTGLLDAIKHATKELGLPDPINITPHGKDEA